MSLRDIMARESTAYIGIGFHVWRVRAITSRDLLAAGVARVFGLASIAAMKADADRRAHEDGLRRDGMPEELIAQAMASHDEARAHAAGESLRLALAADAQRHDDLILGIVIASVNGFGILREPLADPLGASPEVARWPGDWPSAEHTVYGIEPVSLVRDDAVPAGMSRHDAMLHLADRGQVLVTDIPPAALMAIAGTANQLAEGGAASAAPFRGRAGTARADRQDRAEVRVQAE